MKNRLRLLLNVFYAALTLSMASAACAQFVPGQVLTAAQLNVAFSNVLQLTGGTLSGPLTVPTLNSSNVAITGGTITGLSAPIPPASGGTGATTATGATSNLQYLQGATGSTARSLTSKLSDVVSALDFAGVDPTGAADSTIGLQAWLNSGSKSLYLPQGNYKYTSLTIPDTVGLTIFGDGPKSCLIQNGAGIKYPTQASTVFPTLGTIRDLCFDGTNGSGNTLDTTYTQNTDLLNLYFTNPPAGFASLKLDGNPASSTYMHDMRVRNIRVYNNAFIAGKAGIELGSFASDTSIDGYIGNGNFVTNYMLLADVGAQTTTVSNSHPYNAAINVVKLAGSNNDFAWNNVVIDNANEDLFYSLNNRSGRFSNVFLQQIHAGYSGIVFDNSYNNKLVGVSCNSNGSSSVSCALETNGSSGNSLKYGTIDNVANYSNVFNLSGLRSSAQSMGLANTVVLNDAVAGNSPLISAQGTDANVALSLSSQGTYAVAFYTRHFGNLQAEIIDTPSANRALTFTGSNGGNPTIGTTAGNVGFGTSIAVNGSISATTTGAMPLYSTSGTGVNAPHMVQGSVTLSSGSATATLSGSSAFSSSSSYTCTANDTTAANAVKVSQGSGTSITFAGTGTDTVQFLCVGN
ncbi:transporter [Burkholderia cenocepacia]|uniref:transporter n=1 Tax=Burkholderia cenocepacia TaxID=95486 RepID=UPI002012B08C|nr:transporter [Burkholderia cenocepacia]